MPVLPSPLPHCFASPGLVASLMTKWGFFWGRQQGWLSRSSQEDLLVLATDDIPVPFISNAMEAGIKLTEANILIFAERDVNALEDK